MSGGQGVTAQGHKNTMHEKHRGRKVGGGDLHLEDRKVLFAALAHLNTVAMAHTSVPAPEVSLTIGEVVRPQPMAGIVPESTLVHPAVRIHFHPVSLRVVHDPLPAVSGAVAKPDSAEAMPRAPLEFSAELIALLALCAPVGCHAPSIGLPLDVDAPQEHAGLVREDLDRQVPVQGVERLRHEVVQLCGRMRPQSGSRQPVERGGAAAGHQAQPARRRESESTAACGCGQAHILAGQTAAKAVGKVPCPVAAVGGGGRAEREQVGRRLVEGHRSAPAWAG